MSAGTTSATPVAAAGDGAPAAEGRDRYLDLLRALALLRVTVFHVFGWAWLTVLFPSMGVMFALAGSLTARSLGRPGGTPRTVIGSRLRRLLPPLWAFSAVMLGLLFLGFDWRPQGAGGAAAVLTYLLPVGAPPYPESSGFPSGVLETTWAADGAGPLWYLRAYLWFVVASPLLLRLYRRAPWPTLLAPLALTGVFGTGLVMVPGETGEVVKDFCGYGSCWLLGFAHQDGATARLPRYVSVSCATALMGLALWWASAHQGEQRWNLDDVPPAQALWSFGFVAVLLVYAPAWRELPGRWRRWDGLVTLANNRAVTVYLWHNLLIALTFPVLAAAGVGGTATQPAAFLLLWPMLAPVVLVLGPLEDLAAGRRVRMWPTRR
ncbi:acyltransferase [Streptomyces sp. NPDC047130]|uniref:acyltransferase family protein n=1 Tax=Streptomyces sp. NPDC047130 TaxID=3155261 RepID=UPI0033CCDB5D